MIKSIEFNTDCLEDIKLYQKIMDTEGMYQTLVELLAELRLVDSDDFDLLTRKNARHVKDIVTRKLQSYNVSCIDVKYN